MDAPSVTITVTRQTRLYYSSGSKFILIKNDTHVCHNSDVTHVIFAELYPNIDYTIMGTVMRPVFTGDIERIIGDFGAIFQGSYAGMFSQCTIDKIEPYKEGDPIVLNTTDTTLMFGKAKTKSDDWNWLKNFDTSRVTCMNSMFNYTYMNTDISNWDVSNVTNMEHMFADCVLFNQPIGKWNVSKVTNMSYMFTKTRFNHNISTWNVSNVTNMAHMFSYSLFDQYIGNWDVSNVTNMAGMFWHAQNFNQDISKWNVSKVSNMSNMFGNSVFDGNISDWNVCNVENMFLMFCGSLFNQPISNWNVSKVKTMACMFQSAKSFNQDIDKWDVSNVTDMNSMFCGAEDFNQDLNNWNVLNVTNMASMFNNASKFNGNISDWNVSNVTDMSNMFKYTGFNSNIEKWNVSNVTSMSGMFSGTYAFNQPIGEWNVSNVMYMDRMFLGACNFDQNVRNWDVKNASKKNMFDGARTFLEKIDDIGTYFIGRPIKLRDIEGVRLDSRDCCVCLGTGDDGNVVLLHSFRDDQSKHIICRDCFDILEFRKEKSFMECPLCRFKFDPKIESFIVLSVV